MEPDELRGKLALHQRRKQPYVTNKNLKTQFTAMFRRLRKRPCTMARFPRCHSTKMNAQNNTAATISSPIAPGSFQGLETPAHCNARKTLIDILSTSSVPKMSIWWSFSVADTFGGLLDAGV